MPRMISSSCQLRFFWKGCARYDKIAKNQGRTVFNGRRSSKCFGMVPFLFKSCERSSKAFLISNVFTIKRKWMENLDWSSFRFQRLRGFAQLQKLPSGILSFHRVSDCPSRFEAISRCLSGRQDAEAASVGTKRLQMGLTGSEGKNAQWPQPIPRNFER